MVGLTKPIQDYLLPYLENGHVLLVGATTENPIMSLVPAVRSRCQIFEFQPLHTSDVQRMVERAAHQAFNYQILEEIAHMIANTGSGDVRTALYYLAVLLEAGDLESVVRSLKDMSALDMGLADPERAVQVITLANTALEIGLPRASTHVAMATMLLTISPRSDFVMQAYRRAAKDAQNASQHPMPTYLRDVHYKGADKLRGQEGWRTCLKNPKKLLSNHIYQRTW